MPAEIFSPRRTMALSNFLFKEKIYANQPSGRTVERPIGTIGQEELGLNSNVLRNMTQYITFLDSIIQAASKQQEKLSIFFSQFLTEDARIRLNVNQPIPPNYNPFPIGSVVRVDSVLTGDPYCPIRICDINPSLLHYAPNRRLVEMTSRTGLQTDSVTHTLGQESIEGLANVILTNKRYKVKPQLDWIANRVRSQSQKNFHVIDYLSYQNRSFNNPDEFGLIVNHTRETAVFRMHSQRPTIYGGIARLIESKLFPRILPEIAPAVNYDGDLPADVVNMITIPSKLLWFRGLDVPTRIDNGVVNESNPFGKVINMEDITDFFPDEARDGRLSCILKTTDSSGAKGVKVISGRSREDLLEQIHKKGNRMADDVMLHSYNSRNPKVLILQPFYDSRLKIEGRKHRIKVDTFLQKKLEGWKVIGSGAQLRPDDHLMVHGGSGTERLIIPDSWAA